MVAQTVALPNIKKLFLPDPGYIIVDCDLAQADAQVVAWEAEDIALKEIFRDPDLDLHTENAKAIFGHTSKRNRQLAKGGVHALNYGAKARTLAAALGITIHEAERFTRLWFSAHPNIREWQRRIDIQISTTRTVTNVFGNKRYYFDRMEHLLPEALAWIPQCVPTHYEVLTPCGWQTIKEVTPTTPIATWGTDACITFEVPTQWNRGKTNTLYNLEGLGYSCTENHRIPYYNAGRKACKVANPLTLPKGARTPRTGYYSGNVDFPEALLTYIAAFQADGYFDKRRGCIQFEFMKQRKIDRLENALQTLNIPYSKNLVHRGATTFYIKKAHALNVVYKTFGAWLLSLSATALDFLLLEVEFWDGWRSPQGELWFSSVIKENCEWLMTLSALRNKRARWLSTDVRGKNPVYRITIAPNKGKRSTCQVTKQRLDTPVDVACPTVSTGFFLLRAKGEISITGNSTVALVINRALVNVDKNLLPKVQPLMQVHDSLVMQIHKSVYPAILPELKRNMEITIPYPDPLIIPVGIEASSSSWGAVKEVDWSNGRAV